jgi:hypothetical protein
MHVQKFLMIVRPAVALRLRILIGFWYFEDYEIVAQWAEVLHSLAFRSAVR